MTEKCPHCGAANPDNLPFCNNCGEPIDQDLRLIMDIEQASGSQNTSPKAKLHDYDDFSDNNEEDEEDGGSHLGLIIGIAIIVVAAVAVAFFLF